MERLMKSILPGHPSKPFFSRQIELTAQSGSEETDLTIFAKTEEEI
jgi:hypothetical protein